ncbi:MAG: DinB family protein [Ardenticatenaceae bacterium]|nr:DinB family protein [Ardenticatenaceae bacterium]MCB9443835.1 DinB family protein [Ardenticatenaceae bacterium]
MAAYSFWRLELLARLAAERSYLLRQLWALDEATLTAVPLSNGRTAKDIIAHVAAWDSLVLSRLRMVGNGRINQIEPQGIGENRDVFNAELYQRYQNSSLKLALAFALRERSNLIYAFNQLSDVELEDCFTLPWGEETSRRDWFVQRYEHDALHAAELESWRKTLPPATKRQIGSKPVLRAILKAARQEFTTLVDLVPPDERVSKPVRGAWTLKDLVGHLTDWEQLIVDGLRQLLLDQTPEFAVTITDFAAFDEAHVAVRRPQSWRQVWGDFNRSRKALDDAFQQFPELFFSHTLVTPWGKEMPAYFWLTICFGHDHEHAIDLRQTLPLVHWPKRFIRQPAGS